MQKNPNFKNVKKPNFKKYVKNKLYCYSYITYNVYGIHQKKY